MRNKIAVLTVVALVLFVVPAAVADSITFTATLAGANEVPPSGSTATGLATVVLDTIANTVSVNISFTGLSAPATAAHIHCCAPIGTNVGVALPFTGFPNATSGTYSNTFDLTTMLTSSVTLASFIAGIESGQAYVNIHDAEIPSGEIRGQLHVPEPSEMAMLGIAVAGMLGALRKKFSRNFLRPA